MLNHEVFDAIINYYNNSPAKKKVVISFEKDNYVVKVDVVTPCIVLNKNCSDNLMDVAVSLFGISYYITKITNNNIIIVEHDPSKLFSNLNYNKNTTINPSNALFTIYTSIYA